MITEDLNAQQPHDGCDPETVKLQFLASFVSLDLEIHFNTLDQFVKIPERQSILADDRLQFPVHCYFKSSPAASHPHVFPPAAQLAPPPIGFDGFIVRQVIDLATEGVESGHAVPFGFRQENKSQCQI